MCEYCEKDKIRKLKYSKINPNEYIGKKFGEVTIIDCYWINKNGRHRLYVDYKCECGNIKTTNIEHLIQKHIISCGCFKVERIITKNTKHNLYKENKRIFDVWNNMIQRCENPKNLNYKNYGGRGIKVCDEWHNLKKFIQWANSSGYEARNKNDRRNVLSIERINVNGNYEPSNCKWIPFKEQNKNKRYCGKQCVGRKLGDD